MSGLRTADDVLEEYNTVRAAYLNAVSRASYSITTGGGSRSKTNQDVNTLRSQMKALSNEYKKLTGSNGLRVIGVTPV